MKIYIDELESYVDGRAFCKDTGLVWEHRLENTKKILNGFNPNV